MKAFNSRLRPKEKFGYPIALFNFGIPAFILFSFSMFCTMIFKIILIILGLTCAVLAVHGYINHKNMLFLKAINKSKKEGRAYLPVSVQRY